MGTPTIRAERVTFRIDRATVTPLDDDGRVLLSGVAERPLWLGPWQLRGAWWIRHNLVGGREAMVSVSASRRDPRPLVALR